MSAESPRRLSRCAGQIVRPQPVSDKSVMESVVDFIQDVVPQAYSSSAKTDEKEGILWVRFEYSDINDISASAEGNIHNGNTPPLLIILGYSNGIQMWIVPANGDAQEVLSLREKAVKAFCVLPTPESVFHTQDVFVQRRPLVAYSDNSNSGLQQFGVVSFLSLRTGDQVHTIKFKNPVCNILANKRVLIVSFPERIAVFDACTFKDRFTITSCFPCPGPNPNPVALSTRWLAYADRKLVSVHQSRGGMSGEHSQSYTATVIHAAKTLTKGLTMFGETVASSLTGAKTHSPQMKKELGIESPHAGIITVIDIQNVGEGEMNVHEDSMGEGIVAHFVAHPEPITAIAFDPSGMLLLTADKAGHNFNIFRLVPHAMSSHQGAIHHLYTLYRGDTTAKVQDVAFSIDSRWVAVSTLRGTTHLFPITPYGGPISVRTHTSPRVVNKLSRFHKSAGLEDIPSSNTGRNSPSLSGSPGSTTSIGYQGLKYDGHATIPYPNPVCRRMGNPRLAPYPQPTCILPLAQLRQPLTFAAIGSTISKSPPTKGRGSVSGNGSENVRVVATFAPPRAWLVGSPNITREKGENRPVGALYVIGCNGNLIEYSLDPHPAANVQKVNDDSNIELDVQAQAQWNLCSKLSTILEVKPPLPSTNPLMMAQEMMTAVQTDKDVTYGGRPRLYRGPGTQRGNDGGGIEDESWLSQVEIITHAGPHRRLWMGPQFSFQTFQQQANTTILSPTSSALLSHSPEAAVPGNMDIFTEELNWEGLGMHPTTRSNPVAMPASRQSSIPLLIEAGSGSFEQSPGLLEVCGHWPDGGGGSAGSCSGGRTCEHLEDQLRENLADAMMESPVKERRGSAGGQRCSTSEFQGSMEELSSSSSHSGSVSQAFDARASPPHSMEHVLVFPTDNGSPNSS